MIDYEKLKIAHYLIKQIADKGYFFIQYIRTCYDQEITIDEVEYLLCCTTDNDEEFKNIDDLIIKLKELINEELPRYEIGQEIWFINSDNEIKSMLIQCIDYCHPDGYYYKNKFGDFVTSKNITYPSRETLIDAQIEYWKSLKGCEHESYGKQYGAIEWSTVL